MMKLFVDDIRNAPDKTWTVVRTIEMAKKVLQDSIVDDLSLDHDMGGGYEGDGSELVKWMAANDKWPVNKPTVHSANPVGRAYMMGVIERYGPYGTGEA